MSDEEPYEDLDVEPLDADGDVDAAVEDLFTEVDVGDVDEETVWAELTEDEGGDGAPAPADEADVVADEDGEPPAKDGEGTVVPKASYCQQCEHFSPPPGVACENPGTEIVELVDVRHFRVRNCPVVARRSSATHDITDDDD